MGDELFKSFGLGNLGEMNVNSDMGNPMEMLFSLMGQNQGSQNKSLTPEQEKEMEEFYSKMSSNEIDLDNNIEIVEDNDNLNILDDQDVQNPEKSEAVKSVPDFSTVFKNIQNNSEDINFDSQLQQINEQLIS